LIQKVEIWLIGWQRRDEIIRVLVFLRLSAGWLGLWGCAPTLQFLVHTFVEHIKRLGVARRIKVVFVSFQRFFTAPLHVLYQLLEAALNLSLGLGCFVDVANGDCDMPF